MRIFKVATKCLGIIFVTFNIRSICHQDVICDEPAANVLFHDVSSLYNTLNAPFMILHENICSSVVADTSSSYKKSPFWLFLLLVCYILCILMIISVRIVIQVLHVFFSLSHSSIQILLFHWEKKDKINDRLFFLLEEMFFILVSKHTMFQIFLMIYIYI